MVAIEPTEIQIGVFQFHNGEINEYKMIVDKVSRDKDVVWNHSVYASGVITYNDGRSYPSTLVLTYTDGEYLDKLADAMQNVTPIKLQ